MRFVTGFFRSSSWYWFGDIGLLVIRLGLGVMFIIHGLPIVAAGSEVWTGMGEQLGEVGLPFNSAEWGLAAGLIELLGGLFLMVGFYTRLAATMLFLVMSVAVIFHLQRNDEFLILTHAIENAIVFLGLILAGPGKYSLDEKLYSMHQTEALEKMLEQR